MISLINPTNFNKLSEKIILFIGLFSLVLFIVGIYWGLVIAPIDYQQGEMVRIMYIHVPSAWMALLIYSFIALMSMTTIIFRNPITAIAAKSAAPIGLIFTLNVLLTGAIWGRPMWGVWWVWDARLTSVMFLFFIYIGYILLLRTQNTTMKSEKIAAIYAIIGFINIPIIKFSVDWWNTLHQPASILKIDGPSIHSSMLYPLIIMFFAFSILFLYLLLLSMRIELIKNKIRAINQRRINDINN